MISPCSNRKSCLVMQAPWPCMDEDPVYGLGAPALPCKKTFVPRGCRPNTMVSTTSAFETKPACWLHGQGGLAPITILDRSIRSHTVDGHLSDARKTPHKPGRILTAIHIQTLQADKHPFADRMKMRDYSEERSLPECPPCKRSALQLKFDGHRLRFMGSARSYHAVSGRRLSQGFDYSIARQRIPRQGPIPEGRYWIRPSQLWTRHFYHIYEPASVWDSTG